MPFAPGGGVDVVARMLSTGLAREFGQPVVVENRPGASGSIAARYVSRAKPDGYTLMLGNSNTFYVNDILMAEEQPDLPAAGAVGWFPYILVVSASSPVNSLQDLIDLAKSRKGGLNYSTPGVGTPHHLAMETLKYRAGIELTHVPYNGAAPAVSDLMAGHVDAMFIDYPAGKGFLQGGKLKALGVGNRERSELLPDVPTLREQGVADFEVIGWLGLAQPEGVPEAISKKIAEALSASLATPALREQLLNNVGMEPAPKQTPEELARFLESQRTSAKTVIENQKITLN
ncbi:MAG: tripartite tricarboxylate transporter substrate binding protein [Pigmentiphaga sp.]|nr:tripartite tricarboxylate transporter substrate binding protein [Pigmentiphaga sp.]